MRPMQWLTIISLILVALTQSGCASFNRKLKGWLNGGSSPSEVKQTSTLTKFSDGGEVAPRVRRQYKRTTKESLRDQSALEPKAGSLWVMEGQGAYLFSQNVIRLVGDPIAVTMDGDPKDQLSSKVVVIKKLLSKIEERQKARLRNPAGTTGDDSMAEAKADDKKENEKSKDKKEKTASAPAQEKSKEELLADFNVKNVPTRIVERTLDGNYRVKGSQPFLIGSREYKVIVTGIVRAEDFNDDGIVSSKLLDPKFDIVSARRKEEGL